VVGKVGILYVYIWASETMNWAQFCIEPPLASGLHCTLVILLNKQHVSPSATVGSPHFRRSNALILFSLK
jgi:hypothetical protein